MSNLDNITNKVIAEASAQAKAILEQAEAETKDHLAKVRASTEDELAKQKQYAAEQAQGLRNRVEASTRLKARDTLLAAKQNLLTKVFEKAEKKLLALSDADLIKLIEANLKDREYQEGEVLLLPQGRDLKLNVAWPIEYSDDLAVGFAIRKGGISEKYDFTEILALQRTELEQEVLKILQKV